MRHKPCKNPYKRSSEILLEIARNKNLEGQLTYQHILQALGERAFGVALLFFSLPSTLPFSAMPGISLVFGLPIVIFALQMIFARKSLWLPNTISNNPISHKKVSKIINVVVPYLVRLERLLKPRWALMTCRIMEIINGIIILCLAFLLMLPIPFSNFIFGGSIVIFSLGIAEEDGIFIFIGYILFVFYMTFIFFLTSMAINALG
ncbi:MAG: exopolysaccharide biosynthesis protein [Alphaproteobacteria bacterium]|nr:exopolysaccharide biosynthesis protein [Alphaproteobacteria bacterium]MBP9776785.1 exopolysaccharide biosynthesis protein [Alphaproteobacteria bacterium]